MLFSAPMSNRSGPSPAPTTGSTSLHSNIVWGARGNFLEVPTDCPQRDERLGWTGDAQVFVETACYLFDTSAFYAKWLRDLVDAQSDDGGFPDVAPRIVDPADGAAGWADAGTIVPWVVARRFGDDRLLTDAYPAMRRWVDYVHAANPGLVWLERRNNDMGDWLNVGVDTDKDLIATAFFAHSTRLTARGGRPRSASMTRPSCTRWPTLSAPPSAPRSCSTTGGSSARRKPPTRSRCGSASCPTT